MLENKMFVFVGKRLQEQKTPAGSVFVDNGGVSVSIKFASDETMARKDLPVLGMNLLGVIPSETILNFLKEEPSAKKMTRETFLSSLQLTAEELLTSEADKKALKKIILKLKKSYV